MCTPYKYQIQFIKSRMKLNSRVKDLDDGYLSTLIQYKFATMDDQHPQINFYLLSNIED